MAELALFIYYNLLSLETFRSIKLYFIPIDAISFKSATEPTEISSLV
jgi:hypothetical protein